jgi:hypothetical protein
MSVALHFAISYYEIKMVLGKTGVTFIMAQNLNKKSISTFKFKLS